MPRQELDNGMVDEAGPSRPVAKSDNRIDLREPEPETDNRPQTNYYQDRSLWNVFARCKYWAATKGPRLPGKRPDDLKRAAILFRDAFEMAWRAGYKGEHVADLLMISLKTPMVAAKICPTCGGSFVGEL